MLRMNKNKRLVSPSFCLCVSSTGKDFKWFWWIKIPRRGRVLAGLWRILLEESVFCSDTNSPNIRARTTNLSPHLWLLLGLCPSSVYIAAKPYARHTHAGITRATAPCVPAAKPAYQQLALVWPHCKSAVSPFHGRCCHSGVTLVSAKAGSDFLLSPNFFSESGVVRHQWCQPKTNQRATLSLPSSFTHDTTYYI